MFSRYFPYIAQILSRQVTGVVFNLAQLLGSRGQQWRLGAGGW